MVYLGVVGGGGLVVGFVDGLGVVSFCFRRFKGGRGEFWRCFVFCIIFFCFSFIFIFFFI